MNKSNYINPTRGLEIDYETADRITLLTLQDHYDYLVEELKDHKENGAYMHPDDVRNSEEKYIPSLRIVIGFFGGDV
jgi:hypothetical protein